MDNASRPKINVFSSSSSPASRNFVDRQNEKLIRHKLFLLSCDKLAALRQSSDGDALQKNLLILGVCRRAKAPQFYPVNECGSLLTERDKDTAKGPLYSRRSTKVAAQAVPTPTTISPTQAAVTDGFTFASPLEQYLERERTDSDIEIDFEACTVPDMDDNQDDSLMEIDFSHGFEALVEDSGKRLFSPEGIFEYQVKDSVKAGSPDMWGVEEGADALDMLMEEDGTSMARKRKSRQIRIGAQKRHCDEDVSPMSVTAPIPIPRPPKQPDQVVLDTLIPLRGFFQFR